MTQTAQWQDLFKAAMLELDPDKLRGSIETAVSAIQQRLDELRLKQHEVSLAEVQQMYDALSTLRTLHNIELKITVGPGGERARASDGEAV
jgi:hypothetical protein